ncbi:hypothetical protein QR680_005561 [Steinernema hermaphroditum]|uniref:Protein kinase domain-containing protein n=1 Tax=Steinernema hermaphroditum TaxID=289476 RepID=A0AA39HUU3_9BILA|nr:hypothetical protein QR680_005561 [Steinernema hermaphroditum]
MSVLLNDENLCPTDVVVSDVIESRSTLGHTDYRLVVTAVPRNGIELEVRKFTLLTRFRQLHRLWSQLAKIHQQLYLHGTFPEFAQPRFFKKTEPDTIIERVEGTKRFLNFVFESSVLCKSNLIQDFFQQAVEMEVSHDMTEPIETNQTYTATPDVISETPPSESLEEVCLNSPGPANDSVGDSRTSGGDDFFEFSSVTTNPFDSESVAENPSLLGRMFPRLASREREPTTTSHFSIQNRSDISISAESLRPTSRRSSVSSVGARSLPSGSASSSVRGSIAEVDYLVQAGHFIATAQRAETEKAYELAFHCYKNAVNILLQGVQFESDLVKRNAVRKKTVKYLMKAERVGRVHLSFDGTTFDIDSWLNISLQDPSLIAFQASNSALKAFKFTQVLPSLDAAKRVLLVEDADGAKYVMKFLEKSSSKPKSPAKPTTLNMNIVPIGVSNMVQMHKFFETDNFIILLLEYIEGGLLWAFLSKYFASCSLELTTQREEESNDLRETLMNRDEPSTSVSFSVEPENVDRNVYSGRKVSFSVGYDPLENEDEAAFDTVLRQHASTRDSFDSAEELAICPLGVDAAASLAAGLSPTSSPAPTAHRSGDLPFRTVLSNSTLNAAMDQFSVDDVAGPILRPEKVEVDEEAPAKINLGMGEGQRRRTLSQKDGAEMNIEEALNYCKTKLTVGHKWSKSKTLPEPLVAHWVASLASALYLLHSQNIIIGDLRPENLLIDMEGNLMLTYCSRWTNVEHPINQNARESKYCAPELWQVENVTTDAVDRYSLGLILYELLCGVPFYVVSPHGPSNYAICNLPIPPSAEISFAAHDLLTRLLIKNPSERLSDDDLRAHPFFSSFDWRQYDSATVLSKQSECVSEVTVSNFKNASGANLVFGIGSNSPKSMKSPSDSLCTEKAPAPEIAKNIAEPFPVSLVELT